MKGPAKTVAAIHDLSGVGRCALTVVMPVLSVLGAQVCPVPTAVLSAHTAFCHLPVLLVPACILLPRNIEKGCLATSLSINVRGGSPCHILQYESRSVLFLHLYSGNLNIDIRNLKPRHILNRIFHLFLNFFRNFHNTVIIFQV